MKVLLSCHKCVFENEEEENEFYPINFQEHGVYHLICSKGHESYTCLQQLKFEILSEIAINAIVEGYYREAVISFASCLERFHEFYIQCVCRGNNIDLKVIQDAWKKVSRQSERQLGAFIFLYLYENNRMPELLNEKKVNFRNDVVHKGKIPSKEEAIDFGRVVFNIVAPLLSELKAKYEEQMHNLVKEHIRRLRRAINSTGIVSFLSMRTLLNIADSQCQDSRHFDEWLKRNERYFKKYRK